LREGTVRVVEVVGAAVAGGEVSQSGRVPSCPGPNRCPTPVKAILRANEASTDGGMRERKKERRRLEKVV